MKAKSLSIALSLAAASGMLATTSILAASPVKPCVALIEPQSQPAEQSFKGKIMSQNGVRFILRDEQTDTWYHLDDQSKAGKFLGKTVVIKGTLDGASGTIRIEAISEITA
ncbi:MAG: DUF5818 domain-containing protein [Candidatus Acidiferrales bacterium]